MTQKTCSDQARITGCRIHLDCFSGIAGDMFIGAMFDLGVPVEAVLGPLSSLSVHPFRLHVGRKKHSGIEGCDVRVEVEGTPDAHRHYADIRKMLDEAELPERARVLAQGMFERVAVAEAKVHGTDVESVVFHEVGAVDSIVDILGAALSVAFLNPVRVTSRAIPLGSGWTRCAHGRMPVPAPASVEILKGLPVEGGESETELCTPTGAAIAAAIVDEFGRMPSGNVVAVGYGAGDRTLKEMPNHLRVIAISDEAGREEARTEQALVVEANVDDMSPEWSGYLMERLFEIGAKDVWFSPAMMKKGRPASVIGVLCDEGSRQAVIDIMLKESTTIGVRMYDVLRHVLDHRYTEVDTPFGKVRIKEAYRHEALCNAAPEYEDCRARARQSDAPLKAVYVAAMARYLETTPGKKGWSAP